MNTASSTGLTLSVGVKTDPIEYRYSYDWLFRLLADEGITYIQLGTFFELYQLPDHYFRSVRQTADKYGLTISSLFTSHRELGGFFHEDPAWHTVARHSYERYIQVGSILGARSVGSNPGATLRDQMSLKPAGLRCYIDNMKELMEYAHRHDLEVLTIEPMSCMAEPPTLPEEIVAMADELTEFHRANPNKTAGAGYCADISHGYATRDYTVLCDNYAQLMSTLPYLHELHLRNTEGRFDKTFGFTAEERARGIVDVAELRDFLLANRAKLPRTDLIGYFEIGGPKLGRDYSDGLLEASLRESLRYLVSTFPTVATEAGRSDCAPPVEVSTSASLRASTESVKIAPSVMCADMLNFGREVQDLVARGADMLHFDIMDAHFAPNMPLGLAVIQQLRGRTDIPFDIHLMVQDNAFFIEQFVPIGVQSIAVHAESSVHLDRILAQIRGHGIRAGVALNPATPLSAIDYVVEQIDFVLLMTVNPGFAGQKLVPSALRKIADCRAYLDRVAPHVAIEVDGNVSFGNIPAMVSAGAGILVAGTSSVFHKDNDLRENMRLTREAILSGLSGRAATNEGAS